VLIVFSPRPRQVQHHSGALIFVLLLMSALAPMTALTPCFRVALQLSYPSRTLLERFSVNRPSVMAPRQLGRL
jgi:hypothetical protein